MLPTFSCVAFLVQGTAFSSMDYSRIILIVLSSPPAPSITYSPHSSQDVFLKNEIRKQHSDTPTALRMKSQLLTMGFKTSVSLFIFYTLLLAHQSWVFIGRTDTEAETPILWPLHAKSWLIGKGPNAGKAWGQEEKGTTKDEMAGWHHWLDGHGFGWTPGVGDGQRGLACCDSWGLKESDTTEQLNWTELISPHYALNTHSSHSLQVLFTSCLFCLESSLPCPVPQHSLVLRLKCHFLREVFPDLKYHSKNRSHS